MGTDKNERINGVMQTIGDRHEFSIYRYHRLFAFSSFSYSKGGPSLQGVMPSLTRETSAFQIALQAQEHHTEVAGLNLFNLFGGQNTASQASHQSKSKKTLPFFTERMPQDPVMGEEGRQIQALSNKIGALSLRLQKKSQTKFQLAKHGDPRSITLIFEKL